MAAPRCGRTVQGDRPRTRGPGHEFPPDESCPCEGGPSIVLERAQGGYDYTARFRRQADYAGWLEIGQDKARSPRLLGAALH